MGYIYKSNRYKVQIEYCNNNEHIYSNADKNCHHLIRLRAILYYNSGTNNVVNINTFNPSINSKQ